MLLNFLAGRSLSNIDDNVVEAVVRLSKNGYSILGLRPDGKSVSVDAIVSVFMSLPNNMPADEVILRALSTPKELTFSPGSSTCGAEEVLRLAHDLCIFVAQAIGIHSRKIRVIRLPLPVSVGSLLYHQFLDTLLPLQTLETNHEMWEATQSDTRNPLAGAEYGVHRGELHALPYWDSKRYPGLVAAGDVAPVIWGQLTQTIG